MSTLSSTLPAASSSNLPTSPRVNEDLGDSVDLSRRFGGLERLYGVAGAAAIARAHVVVIGIGGVGSWAAEALARSGVGRITLIDLDHIAESNINRQVHATEGTLGQAKIDAMRERIAQINPNAQVNCIDAFVEPDNWPQLLSQNQEAMGDFTQVSAVIDACDQINTKTALAHWARQNKACIITCGAAGGKRHAHWVDIDDLANTTHDPLLAQLRYRLRKTHGAPKGGEGSKHASVKKIGIPCVFSREAVAPADPSCQISDQANGDGSLNCHGYGSSVSITATFGLCAAGWVLNALAQGEAVNKP